MSTVGSGQWTGTGGVIETSRVLSAEQYFFSPTFNRCFSSHPFFLSVSHSLVLALLRYTVTLTSHTAHLPGTWYYNTLNTTYICVMPHSCRPLVTFSGTTSQLITAKIPHTGRLTVFSPTTLACSFSCAMSHEHSHSSMHIAAFFEVICRSRAYFVFAHPPRPTDLIYKNRR